MNYHTNDRKTFTSLQTHLWEIFNETKKHTDEPWQKHKGSPQRICATDLCTVAAMLLFHRDRKSTPREFHWLIFLRLHSTPPAYPKKFWILENCAKRTDESGKKATSNQIFPCGGLAAFFDVAVDRICFDFCTIAPSTNPPCHPNIQFPFFIWIFKISTASGSTELDLDTNLEPRSCIWKLEA